MCHINTHYPVIGMSEDKLNALIELLHLRSSSPLTFHTSVFQSFPQFPYLLQQTNHSTTRLTVITLTRTFFRRH